jgi:hypothetical protein
LLVAWPLGSFLQLCGNGNAGVTLSTYLLDALIWIGIEIAT